MSFQLSWQRLPLFRILPNCAVFPADVADPVDMSTLVASYPGPALRVTADGAASLANSAAAELLQSDPRWLPEVLDWIMSAGVPPGLRSTVIEVESVEAGVGGGPRGAMVVEWAATPLSGGGVLLLGRDVTLERRLRHTLTESRQRYRDLVEVSSDFAWETDADGRFVFVTPSGVLGFAAEALIGRDARDLAVEEWADLPLPFDTRRSVDQAELWLRRVDGHPACVVTSASPLFGPHGEWVGARGVCRDVTDQVMRSAELSRVRNRERLLAHIVHALRDRLDAAEALQVAGAETMRALGADGCRIHIVEDGVASPWPAVEAGGLPTEPESGTLRSILDEIVAAPVALSRMLGGLRVLGARTEYRRAVNGLVLVWRSADADSWGEDDLSLISGVADHIGIAQAHIAYQERLRRLSERDGLTGLLNRRTFFERLGEAMERPEGGSSALLYVDLDNFKAINDLHGHQQGDAALKAVAALLTAGTRPGDLPGRLGGDELVLWLGRASAEQAVAVAERLIAGVGRLEHLSAGLGKPLGVSIGIAAHHPAHGETVQELIHRADSAMYAAKGRGKGSFAIAADTAPNATCPKAAFKGAP